MLRSADPVEWCSLDAEVHVGEDHQDAGQLGHRELGGRLERGLADVEQDAGETDDEPRAVSVVSATEDSAPFSIPASSSRSFLMASRSAPGRSSRRPAGPLGASFSVSWARFRVSPPGLRAGSGPP